jgi:hypothetical protein
MAMELVQVRLPKKLIDAIEGYVDGEFYASRSDIIRDALRKFMLDKVIGSIPNTGDSVEEVRKIRRELSKKERNLK